MADPLALWHADHVQFSRLLDLLEAQVSAFLAGAGPDCEQMSDIVYYLRQYGDRFHHPREETAFTRLVERDPEMRLPVNRLLQEHRVIARAGDELLERLEGIRDDVMTTRASVETAAATYLVYYRHHLATEEGKVMPRAAQVLSGDDWAAAKEAAPAGPDPLCGADFEERYRALRKCIALQPHPSREG